VLVARPALPVGVGSREVRVDIAWADGWYALVDREVLGVPPESGAPEVLRRSARTLMAALDAPSRRWPAPGGAPRTLEGVVLTGPASRPDADLRSITIYADGTMDRSPSGAGTCVVLAVLDAMGMMGEDRPLRHEGPSGLVFRASIAARTTVGALPAIQPEIAGEAWITGEHVFLLDPRDPLASGFTP
jgi:proline racemase